MDDRSKFKTLNARSQSVQERGKLPLPPQSNSIFRVATFLFGSRASRFNQSISLDRQIL